MSIEAGAIQVHPNHSDDHDNLQRALTGAADGRVVHLHPGIFRINEPLVMPANVTLRGSHAPRWSYAGGTPCVIKGTADFSGDALITIDGPLDGGRIEKISLDGGLIDSGTPNGIQLDGLCRDWQFTDVDITSVDGDGFVGTGETTNWPKGLRLSNVSVYNAGGDGFNLANVTDSYFDDLLAVSNGDDGIVATNCYESTFNACRAVFNSGNGFRVNGGGTTASSDSLGQTTFIAPATDRNDECGMLLAQEGLGPVAVIAPRCRRDGAVIAGGTDSCGIKVLGTSGADDAAPVDIVAGHVTVGVDDGGTGDESPLYGIRFTNAGRVALHGGEYWGVTAGQESSGTNDAITGSGDIAYFTGNRAGKAVEAPALFPGAGTMPILLDDLGSEAKVGALTTAPNFGSTAIAEAWAVVYPTTHPTYDIVKYGAGHNLAGTGYDAGAGLWYPEIPARFDVHAPFSAAGLGSDFHQDAFGFAIDGSEPDPDANHYAISGGISNILAGSAGVSSGVSAVLAMVIVERNLGLGVSAYMAGLIPFTWAIGDTLYYGATFWVKRATSDYSA